MSEANKEYKNDQIKAEEEIKRLEEEINNAVEDQRFWDGIELQEKINNLKNKYNL